MTNLLYVCRYNVDRSPVAALIMRRKAPNASTLNISSAGLSHYKSYPLFGVTDEMGETLRELGYQPERHQNRKLTNDLLCSQDLIFCMEKSHVKEVLQKEPSLKDKVYTLPEYAGFPKEEIHAPSDLIRKVPAFFIWHYMPHNVRHSVYGVFGHTDPRDYNGVMKIHRVIVQEIEFYVGKTLERMIREELISSPTP